MGRSTCTYGARIRTKMGAFARNSQARPNRVERPELCCIQRVRGRCYSGCLRSCFFWCRESCRGHGPCGTPLKSACPTFFTMCSKTTSIRDQGVGKTSAKKIDEFLETGQIERLEKYRRGDMG